MMKVQWLNVAASVAIFFGGSAVASTETEFPTRSQLRSDLPDSARDALDRRAAAEGSKTTRSADVPGGIRMTDRPLQTDAQMRAVREKYSGEKPAPDAEPAIRITDLSGSAVAGCDVLARDAHGSLHQGKYSGWTRVFQCKDRPLLVMSDRALKHGNEHTLITLDRVNGKLKIRGIERGVIISRLKSSSTGNGLTSILWRDGEKVVSLRANDSSEATYAWLRDVAQSLK